MIDERTRNIWYEVTVHEAILGYSSATGQRHLRLAADLCSCSIRANRIVPYDVDLEIDR